MNTNLPPGNNTQIDLQFFPSSFVDSPTTNNTNINNNSTSQNLYSSGGFLNSGTGFEDEPPLWEGLVVFT
jgi:hypothetical protein